MSEGSSQPSLRELVSVGAHFGHRRRFWNPSMAPYIYSTHEKLDIIDLRRTRDALRKACDYLRGVTSRGGRVLFIGTKRLARSIIKEQAELAKMPYINHRWFGGTLTNWKTIRGCITKLEQLEQLIEAEGEYMSKKELLNTNRAIDKLRINFDGIRNIGGLPTVLYVVDVRHEAIAISEAHKMGIPVVAVVDTNSSPDNIAQLIPANDDSQHSIQLITSAIAQACREGAEQTGAQAAVNAKTHTFKGVEVIRDSGS